jgi:hypothetical protein
MSEEPRDLNLTERMIPMKGGKQYLQVADRIVWFRNEYPEGTIETLLVELDREVGFCMFRAEVTTGSGGRATATGTETARDFGDYIEKSETKAVGRALGYLGFGTASAGFEEGGRVVDAPQPPRQAHQDGRSAPERPPVAAAYKPKAAPRTDAELLAIAADTAAMLPRREHAAKAYLARATDPFGAEERAAAVRRIADFDGRDVDGWRDAALAALREQQPASYAG